MRLPRICVGYPARFEFTHGGQFGHTLSHKEGLLGGIAIHKTGSPFPPETEKLALRGLIHQDFLVIVINRTHPHRAGNQNVGASSRVADLPYPLTRGEGSEFDLAGQNGCFFVVEQGK